MTRGGPRRTRPSPMTSDQDFLAGAFFAVVFLAVDVFFAGAFLAVDAFFAGAFLAVDVVAVFLAGAFFAVVDFLVAEAFLAVAPAEPAVDFLVADAFFAVLPAEPAADFLLAEALRVAAAFLAAADFLAALASRVAAAFVAAAERFAAADWPGVTASATERAVFTGDCAAAERQLGQLLRPGDDVLQVGAGGELRHGLLLGLDLLTGTRVADGAGTTHALLEGAEAGDGDLLTASDLAGDGVEHRLERVSGLLAVPLEAGSQGVDQLGLVHRFFPFR